MPGGTVAGAHPEPVERTPESLRPDSGKIPGFCCVHMPCLCYTFSMTQTPNPGHGFAAITLPPIGATYVCTCGEKFTAPSDSVARTLFRRHAGYTK